MSTLKYIKIQETRLNNKIKSSNKYENCPKNIQTPQINFNKYTNPHLLG